MKRNFLKTAVTALSALLIAVVIMFFAMQREAKAQMSAVYQRAFYETCELISGMQVNMKKLLVTGSGEREQEMLSDIARQAQGAQSNLAMLPLGVNTITATLKYVNQTGDYCTTLAKSVMAGAALTEEDRRQLNVLLESCTRFSLQLSELMDAYLNGEKLLTDTNADTETGLYPLSNPASEYPVLLYDGPFSDGQTDEEFKALTGPELNEAQAREKLSLFLGGTEIKNLTYTGDALAPYPCYEYAFLYGGYSVTAGVTKKGGEVMYMLPEENEYAMQLSDRECLSRATSFMESRGYPPMEVSFYRYYEGVLTANLAPVENGVILYPDLVKVQVSMKDGRIIGLEARSYLQNHAPRALGEPTLTKEQAMSLIGVALTAEDARLCVAPLETGEAYCYEVAASADNDRYLIYIDADSGKEHVLYQVVRGAEGTLVQ